MWIALTEEKVQLSAINIYDNQDLYVSNFGNKFRS